MSTTDRTYTTKYKILKGQLISNFHVQNPTKQIEGPSTPSSIITLMKNYRAAACCSCPGNLVVNGDFADGIPNTDYVIPPGWDLLGGDGNNRISDNPSPSPPSGTARVFQLGNIYNKSYLSQRVPTTEGAAYTLSYYLLDAGNLTGGPWDSSANLIYFRASVSDDNTPIGAVINIPFPTVDAGSGWTLHTSAFVATSSSTLLTFTSSQPPNYFYLTDISVTCG